VISRKEARGESLAEQNRGWACQVAASYARRSRAFSLDEIQSAAFLGLVEAEKRFESARGVKFITYATPWIRREILSMFDERPVVRVPRSTKTGRRRRQQPQPRVSVIEGDGEYGLFRVLRDDRLDLEGAAISREQLGMAFRALSDLPAMQRDILIRHLGLGDHEPQTLQEIGDGIGLSRERIRQLELVALTSIRKAIAERTARAA
jgi:RNA polymerase sigma factor (sigma-70 family)